MLKALFRRHRLKSDASREKTGLIPLQHVRRMTVLMDADIADFEQCDKNIRAFCNTHQLDLSILYIDFRKSDANTIVKTPMEQTLSRRDLNWYGRPAASKTSPICAQPSDVFICLVSDGCLKSNNQIWCAEYISKIIRAKSKIGLAGCSFMHNDKFGTFDLLVSDPALSEVGDSKDKNSIKPLSYGRVFNVMTDFLEKII